MSQLVEVRVLGPFRVRTEDGALVDARAWRTAKTRDLVRLLAVAGKVVPVDRIVDVLWPSADPQRGRASLRTAASQIRHVLGDDHLARRDGGLELTGAWVDATAFESAAATARHRLAAGEHAAGMATAWEAVTLYSGDLCEDEPYAEWLDADRERYRGLLRQLLLDAADAACEVGWVRDAAELAHRALAVDPCAERAYRSLMRAYTGLGETEQALGMYQQCRRVLADRLGADPGEETQALHLALLRPASPVALAPPFVGRERWVDQVVRAMSVVREERRSLGLLVTGPPGSGRSRFVEEAATRWPYRVARVPCRRVHAAQPGAVVGALARALGGVPPEEPTAQAVHDLLGPEPVLVVLDDLQWADAASVTALAQLLRDDRRAVLVLGTVATDVVPEWTLAETGSFDSVPLPPLSLEEVAALLRHVLRGDPSRALVEALAEECAGTPAAVVAAARRLLSGGQLVSTGDGMVRVARPAGGRPPDTQSRLAQAREHAGPAGGAALDLLAVLDRCTPVEELARLADVDPRAMAVALDELCDRGLLVQRVEGYRLADPLVREGAYRWLRPTVRRDLHRRVAETAYLPAEARVEHWLRSGEPVLACAAALQAADDALARADDVHARAHLLTVQSFAAEHGVGVEDRIALNERLAEAADRLERPWEARELLQDAVALARSGAPQALARLHRELGRHAETRGEALRAYASAGRVPGLSDGERRRTALSVAAVGIGDSPDVAVEVLQRAVEDADAADDVEAQVEARVLLARAAAQRRDFELADLAAKEGMGIAEAAGSDVRFVRAAHALVQTAAYLGDGRRHLDLVRRAHELSLAAGDAAEVVDVGLTYCLVLHDLGDPEFEVVWPRVSARALGSRHGRLKHLLDAHISLERGHVGRAARLLGELPERLGAVTADDAVRVLRARLLAAGSDIGGAVALLEDVVDDRREAPTMLAPEAAARLAALLASTDPARGRRCVELAVELAGHRLHPREQICVLQARAALLAAEHELEAAATIALAAAMTAHEAGLVLHEADAYELRAVLLTAAGSATRAAAERTRAAVLCRSAGAPLRARTGGTAGLPAALPVQRLPHGR